MKKTIIFIVVLTFIFTFFNQLKAKDQKQFFDLKGAHPEVARKFNPEAEQAKLERYILARNKKLEKHNKHSLISGGLDAGQPSAVNILKIADSTYWQADFSGDLVWTGACYNAGTTSAVFVKISVLVYDAGNNYLGSDYTYIWGGRNVKLTSSGLYTNALGADEVGFWRLWTNISYAQASKIVYSFSYETYGHTDAKAQLDFDGPVYMKNYYGDLDFYGYVKNPSAYYVTYFTKVAFAVFDTTSTYVLDVDWDFVNGSTYGSSTSAIYPGTSEPFDFYFYFAPYNSSSGAYYSGIEWDEASTGNLPEKDPPFGQFATPTHNSTVRSSVAVTGWALDDSGVDSVKIYRTQGSTDVYVGDAVMVEGARPDVAALYPQYPGNTRAGWGLMMLTNFLPNGGNGTFIIKAIATDIVGKSTTLGTKTIYCDNANAVKPFGAIDTPTQGGTASGSSFVNWGWALTPQPNYIPTDGSTLNVYVDGAPIGNPNYNNYRADIASLFPGYQNSNGAAGYFYFDTTGYADGVHTISWTARDSAGNTDGIGSRYFSISNPRTSGSMMQEATAAAGKHTAIRNISQVTALPVNFAEPVRVKKGFTADNEPMSLMPDPGGISRVEICELERIELHLSNPCSGYMIMGNRLTHLPVGSTLDLKKGIFSWIPGPGFLGEFNLVFVEKGPDGTLSKKKVTVTIVPRR